MYLFLGWLSLRDSFSKRYQNQMQKSQVLNMQSFILMKNYEEPLEILLLRKRLAKEASVQSTR